MASGMFMSFMRQTDRSRAEQSNNIKFATRSILAVLGRRTSSYLEREVTDLSLPCTLFWHMSFDDAS